MKKKYIIMILMVLTLLYVPNVFAYNIASCDVISENIMIDGKIPSLVSSIVTTIKIVVPILLVIFGMLDLMKGITAQKDDEIKKGQQIFIKRLISGALVFLVFTIVQLLISFVASDENDKFSGCVNCFINGDCTYKPSSSNGCPKGYTLNNSKTKCVEKS